MLRDRTPSPASGASHPSPMSSGRRLPDGGDTRGPHATGRWRAGAIRRRRERARQPASRKRPRLRQGSRRRPRPLVMQRAAPDRGRRKRPVVRIAPVAGCIPWPPGTCGPRSLVASRRSLASSFWQRVRIERTSFASVSCERPGFRLLVPGKMGPDSTGSGDFYSGRRQVGRASRAKSRSVRNRPVAPIPHSRVIRKCSLTGFPGSASVRRLAGTLPSGSPEHVLPGGSCREPSDLRSRSRAAGCRGLRRRHSAFVVAIGTAHRTNDEPEHPDGAW